MKFMNNHYGQSRIFKHARRVAPEGADVLVGDGFAEGGEGSGGGSGTDGADGSDDTDGDGEESLESLKAELAKAKADAERFKNAIDKNAKEAKKLKGQLNEANANLRAKMTDAEREAEAQRESAEELEQVRTELRTIKYSKRLIGLGMDEKGADEMASVIPAMDDADAFFDALGKFVESVKKTAGEDRLQKFIAENKIDVSAGQGDSQKDDPAMAFAKRYVETQKSSPNVTNKDILKNYM